MTDTAIDDAAKIIWDYMRMDQAPEKADVILVPCSYDTRVADYAVELFKKGYGRYLIFSGNGKGRVTEQLFDKTEAETFADIALVAGVPADRIIVENEARNSGENARFTYELLQKRDLHFKSLLVLQKPYIVRRVFATFRKQWPDTAAKIVVAAPPIPYDAYFDNGANNRQYVIESMVGDLQRIKVYSEQGFQIPQEVPPEIEAAYQQLVTAGFTRRLLT